MLPGKSIRECLAHLKSIYVNILDLLDARRAGAKVKVFHNFEEFRKYTLQTRRIINRHEAKRLGGCLASLLQHIYNPQRNRRG